MILITSANLRWSKRRSKARSASGGIVYGGEADGSTSDVLQRSASGGIVFGGSANGVIESVFRSASGGIVYGGTANLTEFTVFRGASGGITYGGTAVPQLAVVWREAEGGITYGGSAYLGEDISIASPTEIDDLGAWYDATSVSGNVGTSGTLNDLSGNGRHMTNSGGFLSLATVDGRDFFVLGTGARIVRADDNLFNGTSGGTIIVVERVPADIPATNSEVFSVATSPTGGIVYGMQRSPATSSTPNRIKFPAPGFSLQAVDISKIPLMAVARVDWTQKTLSCEVDGLRSEAENASASSISQNLALRITAGTGQPNHIAEILAFRRALTIGEIEAVKTYLRAKHSL